MSYSVILLMKNEVDAVPSSWLIEKGRYCFYPPYKTDSRLIKAKLLLEKIDSDWTRHEVKKIICHAGFYQYNTFCLNL